MIRVLTCASLMVLLAACDVADAPVDAGPMESVSVADAMEARSSHRCVNVGLEGEAELGFPVFIPDFFATGVPLVGAGGMPGDLQQLGPFVGTLRSVLVDEDPKARGAVAYRLVHYFEEDRTGDAFWTDDRAVCAPVKNDPLVCRVNDRMEIVRGTGKFANADGFLFNKGLITITDPTGNPFGSLGIDIHGRVCGDGV